VKTPEERARKWLRLYPRAYRERRGDELVATLLDRARDDPRLRFREVWAVVRHAGSMRFRQSRVATVGACAVVFATIGIAIVWLGEPSGRVTTAPLSSHQALVAHDTWIIERSTAFAAAHDTGSPACIKSKNPDGCWVAPPGYISAPKDPNAPFQQIGVPTPPSIKSPQPVGAIGNMIQPVFEPSLYTVVNSWSTSGGQGFVVFAGALGGNVEQGVIVVVRTVGTVELPNSVRAYRTAEQHGALRLTAARGQDLTAVASDGTIYHFKASADRLLLRSDIHN
jgi:hypothetical protein